MTAHKKPVILGGHAVVFPRWRVFLVSVCSLAFVSHNAEVYAASIGIGSARGYPGEVSSVPFSIREATNLVSAQFDIRFDASKGDLSSPFLVGRNPKAILRSREVAPGVHRVLVYSPNNSVLRTNGFTGRFSFGVGRAERVGSGLITPFNGVLARADGSRIPTTSLSSGRVFVVPYHRDPSSGLVDLFFPSTPDRRYLVQASEDLVRWVNVSTNLATGEFIDFVDTDAPVYPYRFYRTADSESGVVFSAVRRLPEGGVVFEGVGAAEGNLVVQVSEDLVTWREVAIRRSVDGVVSYTDVAAGGSGIRFYRLKSQR